MDYFRPFPAIANAEKGLPWHRKATVQARGRLAESPNTWDEGKLARQENRELFCLAFQWANSNIFMVFTFVFIPRVNLKGNTRSEIQL